MTAIEIVNVCGPVVLKALTAVAPLISAASPAFGFVGDHPTLTTLAFVLGGGTAANLLARVLNVIPLGPWFAFLGAAGRAVSAFGNRRYSAPAWAPFEEFLVKWIHGSSDAIVGGLLADKAPVATVNVPPEPGVPPPAPPPAP